MDANELPAVASGDFRPEGPFDPIPTAQAPVERSQYGESFSQLKANVELATGATKAQLEQAIEGHSLTRPSWSAPTSAERGDSGAPARGTN